MTVHTMQRAAECEGNFIRSAQELFELFERYNIPFNKDTNASKYPVLIPNSYAVSIVSRAKDDLEKLQARNLLIGTQYQLKATEIESYLSFFNDHVDDHNPVKGLTRMYPDRVLVTPVGACAEHCPWCFRDPQSGMLSDGELEAIIDYIRRDPRIEDVILTGGEPFLLSLKRMDWLLGELRAIDHEKIIRFHTRAPIVNPELISPSYVKMIGQYDYPGRPIYCIVQALHYLELYDKSIACVYNIRKAGIPIFNQAPLLRGINDDQVTFNQWMRTMIQCGIKPYYLIATIIKPGINEAYYVPYSRLRELVASYASKYDGLGRPTIIIPIMGRKFSFEMLQITMSEDSGIHFRNTKAEIW